MYKSVGDTHELPPRVTSILVSPLQLPAYDRSCWTLYTNAQDFKYLNI